MELLKREPMEPCEKSFSMGYEFSDWLAYFQSIGADEDLANWLAAELKGQEDI